MKYIVGGIFTLIIFAGIAIHLIIKKIKLKEETIFLNLYKDLCKIKKIKISCKPEGKLNNSYEQGKISFKNKHDQFNDLLIYNIKKFSGKNDIIFEYLTNIKNKSKTIMKSFQSQIANIIKDKKDTIAKSSSSFSSVFEMFGHNDNDIDLTQRGVDCFDSIDLDFNDFIDEIIINLINRYSTIKGRTVTKTYSSENFVSWLKNCVNWQKIISVTISLLSSFALGLLVNYTSSLLF